MRGPADHLLAAMACLEMAESLTSMMSQPARQAWLQEAHVHAALAAVPQEVFEQAERLLDEQREDGQDAAAE